jgi:hypothetical protein
MLLIRETNETQTEQSHVRAQPISNSHGGTRTADNREAAGLLRWIWEIKELLDREASAAGGPQTISTAVTTTDAPNSMLIPGSSKVIVIYMMKSL